MAHLFGCRLKLPQLGVTYRTRAATAFIPLDDNFFCELPILDRHIKNYDSRSFRFIPKIVEKNWHPNAFSEISKALA